ncbi:hypothetical protein CC86DRAFT_387318 [Ophiobolus disseminans]|uniref:Chitosanase n=1 Tax=Ophiobolus disseminans TaxID=1469910 RepID=A0A6A6ZGW8_9PLEO|nr:hypothetical protein CC86DRAFT_387318 [Ophiobolus disseminans]
MKQYLSTVLFSLALHHLGATFPTNGRVDDRTLFGRAVGDTCRASEGSGKCLNTSDCKGISYPTGLCPRDPSNVQCCVEITCRVGSNSGFCRSKSNNGCSGGTFHTGACPGSSDIQCCIKLSTSPTPSPLPTPIDCRKTLSCTFAQIEATSMDTRLAYMKAMQANFFGPLNAGNQFRAIEGVITFFSQNNLGAPNSWVSYVDAGIVEGIQNGGANVLGLHSKDGGNPGTALWADFFRKMKAGGYEDRDKHDFGWSISEEKSTGYGKQLADAKFSASGRESLWYMSTQVFRWIMRNKGLSVAAIRGVITVNAVTNPSLLAFLPLVDDLVDWFTDITDIKPTLCFSKAVWDVVDPSPASIAQLPVEILKKIVPELIVCFKNR